MPSSTVRIATQAASNIIPINLRKFSNGVGLVLTISGTLTASVQVTGDDVQGRDYVPSAGNWNEHDTLTNLTTSDNGNLAFPVTAVRLNVSAWTSGSATLSVIESEST